VAALIAYGSLYPFAFALPPSFGAFWNELLAQRRLWTGLGDVAGNVLLFAPLGAAGVLCAGPGRLSSTRAAGLLGASVAFAFVLQVLQGFEPTRDPALSDVFWNGIGTIAGAGAGILLARHGARRPGALSAMSWFAGFLIGAWGAAELWPLVPSLDWSAIKRSLKPLLLAPSFEPVEFLYQFASVLVVGVLLESIVRTPRVGAGLATLVAGLLAGKLLFPGTALSFSLVAACVAGVAAWRSLARIPGPRAIQVALGMLFAGYTLGALAPFELRAAPAPFLWMPFQAMLEGSMSANLRALFAQLFALGATLWLVRRGGGRLGGAAAALALWVGALETAQRWIVGRTPDITPALLVVGLAFAIVQFERLDAGAGNRTMS
jgi:hypothetical protein